MKTEIPIFLTPDILSKIREADRTGDRSIDISLDLGQSLTELIFSKDGLLKMDEYQINIPPEIYSSEDQRTIWKLDGTEWTKWEYFDQLSGRYYKMIFTGAGKPPTIEISGIKMHATLAGDPSVDTRRKLESLRKIRGTVLDTSLGLGYTAIAASEYENVDRVVVCERDPVMMQFCRENPWSQKIFTSLFIHPILIPSQDFIRTVPDRYFDIVIHDPPRFALAPEVYTENFYQDLFRVLRPGGKLYHYTGDPNRRTRRHSLADQSARLLKRVGFNNIQKSYYGVTAKK